MKLNAIKAPFFIGHARNRATVGAGHQLEAVRQLGDLVTVAHPDFEHAVAHRRCVVLNAVKQPGMAMGTHIGVTEFAQFARRDHSAELYGHREHAVTDAQHRNAEFVHQLRGTQVMLLIGTGVAAGQNNALELAVTRVGPQPILAHITRVNLAKHMRLADAPRNQLGNLGTEIKNEYFLVLHRWSG